MNNVVVTDEAIENQFAHALDLFALRIRNLISFYALFEKRVNNKIKSMRICVKTDVVPVLEYNEQWLCDCDGHLFTRILGQELYRFLLHHCTHRELIGKNAFIASNAVANQPELKDFLITHDPKVREEFEAGIPSRESISEYIGRPVTDDEFYYECVFDLLNQQDQKEQQKQQKQQQQQQQQQQGGDDDQDQDQEEQEGSSSSDDGQDSDKKDKKGKGKGKGKKDNDEDEESGEGQGQGDEESEDSDNGNVGSDSDSDEEDDGDEQDGDGDEQDGDGDSSDNGTPSNGKGKGKGKGQPTNQDGETPFEAWNNAGEENTQEWGENSIVDEMIRQTFENETSLDGWGSMSGKFLSQIEIANKRKANILPIIASFSRSVRTRVRKSTWLRVNKRYDYLPGYRYDRKPRILFAIDSSGSMSDADINKGCAILHNFLKNTEIDVAFWDAQMLKPFQFKRGITKMDAPGRGGTDPSCIGKYLKQHKMHYDGVVLFTDCIWSWEKNNLTRNIFCISSREKYSLPKFIIHHTSIQKLTHFYD